MLHIHRFEIEALLNWLNQPDRKPLILKGARQVGKSSIVRHLAQCSQRTCLEFNFERYPEHASFFKSKHPKTILALLNIHFKQRIDPQKTVLFLDEIQSTPEVIETLRYFYEELPELPIIAAGSLLDFVLNQPQFSVPVGRVDYFHLGPISFENFLSANSEESLLQWIQAFSLSEIDLIPDPIHRRCLELTKQFWLIGGMPGVVAHYVQHQDFQAVDRIKQAILQSYQEDFYKYGRAQSIPLLRNTFKSIPNLIGEKVKYVHIDANSKSAHVKAALDHLSLAKIIYLIHHSHANGIPLNAQVNPKVFKAIYLDIGLLCATLGLSHLSIVNSEADVWINQGSLAEQFIGQTLLQLKPHYHTPELYYWIREKAHSSAEIDYLFQYENRIIPIEVKAGSTGHLKSLHYFMKEKNILLGVRFYAGKPNLTQESVKIPHAQPLTYHLLSLPFYLSGQLIRLIPTALAQIGRSLNSF